MEVVLAIILLVVLLKVLYVQAPPSFAFILSGFKKEPRVLIGTGGFKVPFLERLDKVFLGQVTVDVKTSIPVPTHDFIDVMVDAVCKVRVLPTAEGIRIAAKNFLNFNETEISASIKDSLEGNMREVIGAITLQNLITDRDKFSDEIQKKASTDMEKLGLEVISCNIQNITDSNRLIENLGADNTYAIRKNAAITKANAERDIQVAEQEAKKVANDVRVKTETEIAERNNELAIKTAELKAVSDAKKAEAYNKYGNVAIIDMLTKMNEKVLPQVAENIAKPMGSIKDVTIYGTTGSEVSGMSSNVPAVMKQTFDVVKDVTGVDMSDIMKAGTIQAKTDKNINLTGSSDVNAEVSVNSKK